MQYDLALLTDTNSVICKIIVGAKASLVQREVVRRSRDGGIAIHRQKNNPPVRNQRFLPAPFTQGGLISRRKGERYMKATGIVRRVDDLGRIVIPKEIRRTRPIREGDPLLTTLAPIDRFCMAIHSVVERYKETAE